MDRLGDDVMKFRWTVSLAALALVAGILPAIAQQSTQNQPKSQDRQKIDRKIDAAAATPFMTKHQGDVLKGDLDKGEEMKQDEKVAYPEGGQGSLPTPGSLQGAPLGGKGTPFSDPNAKPADQPKVDPPAPVYHLRGTVCGAGKDLAIFDQGSDWPAMKKEGDMLDPTTKIVKIERGKVRLEHVQVTVHEEKKDDKVVQTKQEKKESYDLYAW